MFNHINIYDYLLWDYFTDLEKIFSKSLFNIMVVSEKKKCERRHQIKSMCQSKSIYQFMHTAEIIK